MKPSTAFCVALSLCSTSAFAMFCPHGFNQISTGNSIEEVIQTCGKPSNVNSYKSMVSEPQEWNYYIKMSPTDQATIKMTVAFKDGKAVNMNVNGIGISNTAICGNTIQIDDTQKSIESACGKPAFINQGSMQSQAQASTHATQVDELTYDSVPPTTLLFENGHLTGKK